MTRSIRGRDIKQSRTCKLLRMYVRSTVRPRIVGSRDEVHSTGSNKGTVIRSNGGKDCDAANLHTPWVTKACDFESSLFVILTYLPAPPLSTQAHPAAETKASKGRASSSTRIYDLGCPAHSRRS